MSAAEQSAGGFSTQETAEDRRLVEALRQGDEMAFATLVDRYHAQLVRLALLYVHDRAVAEEVAQDTWLGVLKGIGRFEGRSSLKTWIFRILANRARTRGQREGRSVPFSSLAADESSDEPAADPSWFYPPGHKDAGWWVSYPPNWADTPERRLLAQETREQLQTAIAQLPSNQQTVITLRDVEGWSSDEVRNVLGVSETNQRVLLHRAREKVRRALQTYLAEA
jgi:RNA polymerase sigma-70 factor (ECF subfamily)